MFSDVYARTDGLAQSVLSGTTLVNRADTTAPLARHVFRLNLIISVTARLAGLAISVRKVCQFCFISIIGRIILKCLYNLTEK